MRSSYWAITTVGAFVLVITALPQVADAGNGGGRGIQRQARDGSCLSAVQPADAAAGAAVGKAVPGRDRLRQCWATTQPSAQTSAQDKSVSVGRGKGWGCGQCPGCRGTGHGQGFRGGHGHGFRGGRSQETISSTPTSTEPATESSTIGSGDKTKTSDRPEDTGGMGVSGPEHRMIQELVLNHKTISRTVRDISGGTETTTTTSRPEMVKTLREHVRAMVDRLHEGRPVRMWDPIFRDVFNHAHEIKVEIADTDGGVIVTETSSNAEVVPMIRAHARAVTQFVEKGHAAIGPPWAGRGRVNRQSGTDSE